MPHSSAAAVSGQESFRPNNIAVAGISKGMPLKINMKYYKYLNLKKMFHIFKILFFPPIYFQIFCYLWWPILPWWRAEKWANLLQLPFYFIFFRPPFCICQLFIIDWFTKNWPTYIWVVCMSRTSGLTTIHTFFPAVLLRWRYGYFDGEPSTLLSESPFTPCPSWLGPHVCVHTFMRYNTHVTLLKLG